MAEGWRVDPSVCDANASFFASRASGSGRGAIQPAWKCSDVGQYDIGQRSKVRRGRDAGQHRHSAHPGGATGLKVVAAVADHRNPRRVKPAGRHEGKTHAGAGFRPVTGIMAWVLMVTIWESAARRR